MVNIHNKHSSQRSKEISCVYFKIFFFIVIK